MITKMRVAGFKAWKDTGEFRLAPITVFFGKNSSGKTSLLQFLLMLKRTALSADRGVVLQPADDRTPIDLGTYYDMAYNHDVAGRLRFALEWKPPSPVVVDDWRGRSSVRHRGDTVSFRCEIGCSDASSSRLYVQEMEYRLLSDDEQRVRVGMRLSSAPRRNGAPGTPCYQVDVEPHTLERPRGRPPRLPAPTKFYGFPELVMSYYYHTGFMDDLALQVSQLFERVHCLGPLRLHPARTYTRYGGEHDDVGWQGENCVEALLATEGRRVLLDKGKGRPVAELVARALQKMGMIQELSVHQVATHRQQYEVLVRVSEGAPEVNLTDVGFGVSQVLPVAVQCFCCKPNSTVILEQPEIHLHTSVQASLADLFIDAIHTREGGKPRNTQLIVESHSEHFLHRLQRRIAEEKLRPDEVAVYFCETNQRGAERRDLKLDLLGNITNWPEGFFGDTLGDLIAMAEAAMARGQRSTE